MTNDCGKKVHGAVIRMTTRALALALSLSAITACGGFRGGYMSAPYVGDTQPDLSVPETRYQSSRIQVVELPDLDMNVALNNTTQTYDFQVFLFIIPGYVNLSERRRSQGDMAELSLRLMPKRPGLSFDPRRISITVDGQTHQAKTVWFDDWKKRRQAWDAFSEATRSGGSARPPIPDSSQWRTQVEEPILLDPAEQSYEFPIVFDCAVPTPDQNITLEMSQAVTTRDGSPLPAVKFLKLRWREGYT